MPIPFLFPSFPWPTTKGKGQEKDREGKDNAISLEDLLVLEEEGNGIVIVCLLPQAATNKRKSRRGRDDDNQSSIFFRISPPVTAVRQEEIGCEEISRGLEEREDGWMRSLLLVAGW